MSIIVLTLMITAKSTYAMQSRPDGKCKVSVEANYFFEEIRKMESTVLGLPTNFDTTTWLDSSGNGVDVHMAKNTEWGTAAMLSASAYGTAPSGQSSESTTGNATGIYQMADANTEYVTGIWNSSNGDISKIKNANSRYYNLYTNAVSISGDSTTETKNWKSANSANFIDSTFIMFVRGQYSLFGYDNYKGEANSYRTSRSVLVIGAGL